jgi:hypothetical protein
MDDETQTGLVSQQSSAKRRKEHKTLQKELELNEIMEDSIE